MTVYECAGCGGRAVGEQRCAECSTFMRRVGLGGACPSCDEAITVADLIGPGMTP
jgi:DNA polymerase II large subunit